MPKKPELQHLDTSKRPERIPIDGPRNILSIPNQDPNYHYTWQFGDPGNLERFLNAGYEFVQAEGLVGDPNIDKPSRLPGMGTALTCPSGPKTLYALRIRQEWYDEDFARAQAQIDDQERQASTPSHEGGYGEVRKSGGSHPKGGHRLY